MSFLLRLIKIALMAALSPRRPLLALSRIRIRVWPNDLDLNLHIPQRGLTERNFVLYPLADLAPELVLPRYGALSSLLARCSSEGLRRL